MSHRTLTTSTSCKYLSCPDGASIRVVQSGLSWWRGGLLGLMNRRHHRNRHNRSDILGRREGCTCAGKQRGQVLRTHHDIQIIIDPEHGVIIEKSSIHAAAFSVIKARLMKMNIYTNFWKSSTHCSSLSFTSRLWKKGWQQNIQKKPIHNKISL